VKITGKAKFTKFLASIPQNCLAGHRWLMPVILATQEEEVRRIMV
jgi:hypothetical protein